MDWEQSRIDRLDLALNESTVCGLRCDAERGEVRLLVEVVALPETGPVDHDPRRVIVLSSVASVHVTLRAEHAGEHDEYGPVLPVASLDELELFFARLDRAHPMYGWEFIDVVDLPEAWRVQPSLHMRVGPGDGMHSLRWFTECRSTVRTGEPEDYVLQGVIRFDDLAVERADGSTLPLEHFLDDGARWWQAFRAHDRRLSTQSQHAASEVSMRWRQWGAALDTKRVPAGD
jgi:hypothetical protein